MGSPKLNRMSRRCPVTVYLLANPEVRFYIYADAIIQIYWVRDLNEHEKNYKVERKTKMLKDVYCFQTLRCCIYHAKMLKCQQLFYILTFAR